MVRATQKAAKSEALLLTERLASGSVSSLSHPLAACRDNARVRSRLFPIQEICVGDSDAVSRLVDTFKVSLV